jgi:hypothetical protein
MQGYGRTKAGVCVDLSGIGQLVVNVDRCSVLKKFAKSRPCICESPTWCFDLKVIQRFLNFLSFGISHEKEWSIF